ncbi:unnamed protein product [Symbiodinium microadriaticum]|nr:unnamed protein product [Symbiodinium microadriaticum]
MQPPSLTKAMRCAFRSAPLLLIALVAKAFGAESAADGSDLALRTLSPINIQESARREETNVAANYTCTEACGMLGGLCFSNRTSEPCERRRQRGEPAWACACDIALGAMGPLKPDLNSKLSESPFLMTHDSATGFISAYDLFDHAFGQEDADLGVSPGPSPQHRRSDEEEYADFQRWLRERRRGSRRAQRHDDDEEALADTPFQDFKYLAKDSGWLNDVRNADILLDKMNSPEYYGDDQEEHLLSALSRVTYHMKRQKQETARQFLARWETAERKVKEHRVDLPSVYRGFLLINALGLSESDIKALLNYTHGSIEPGEIRTWLRKHETKLQANQLGAESQGPKAKSTTTSASSNSAHLIEEASGTNTEPEKSEIEELETLLADLAETDEEAFQDEIGPLEEAETAEILSVMLKERKKKTFVQSNQLKKERELSRGYGARQSAGSTGPMRSGVYRLSISELKKRTRCKGCGKLGHWKRECPEATSAEKAAHFLELELEDEADALFCHHLELHDGPFDHEDYTAPCVSDVFYGECVEEDEACATIMMGNQGGKRARAEPETPAWVKMWSNLVLKLLLFVRPVLRMLQNLCRPGPMEAVRLMRGNWEEIPLAYLNEVQDELSQVIKNRRRERGRIMASPPEIPDSSGESTVGSPRGPPYAGPPRPVPVWQMQQRSATASGSAAPAMNQPWTVDPTKSSREQRELKQQTPSVRTSTDDFEMVPPQMEIPNEKLIDRGLQDRVLANGAQLIYRDMPSCHCERVAGVEVTVKNSPNYQKTFYRCYNPPSKQQCRFFAWTIEQPLLDDRFAQLRAEVQKDGKSSPRELLCQLIQAQCNHRYGYVNSGTNQHFVMKRCRMCQKIMERYRRPPTQPPIHENKHLGSPSQRDYEDWMEEREQGR